MADSDRPDLGLQVDGEIETKQVEVDASHWHQLRELQIFIYAEVYTPDQLLNPPPPPAKRPIRLRAILASYACALFNLEASEYPRDPRLKYWLEKLAERTRRRVMDTVARLESGGMNSLRHHNVRVSEMSESIDEALRPLIEDQLRKLAMAGSPSPPETIAAQLQRLRVQCRWTIEELAGAANISSRTVARHLSGEAIPYPKNIFAYEQAISKRLKIKTVIRKMS
jgi:hypothetical protein